MVSGSNREPVPPIQFNPLPHNTLGILLIYLGWATQLVYFG